MSVKVPNTNNVIIAGRATRDGELNYTKSQSAYLNFGIANNQNWRDKSGNWQENPVFVNITLWGKAAERLQDKIKKGDPVIVEGKLSSYIREVEGKKQTIVSINAYKVQLLEKESQTQSSESSQETPEEVPAHIEERKPQESMTEEVEETIEEDDRELPF